MKSIDEHIKKDQSEIESAKAEGNFPKVRHLTEELKELEEYKDHHPDDKPVSYTHLRAHETS